MILKSICQESFYEFVKAFWNVIIPEDPVWNWHIHYLCDMFQKDAERVFQGLPKKKDTIVNISPGTTKSTILSIMAPAWVHCRRPDMRVIAASHTQTLTFELGRKCRMIEESELYQCLFPHVIPSHDQWTKSLFMNTKGGGRMSCTVGGMSPVGFHAHFIIVDDPLDPQAASTISDTERQSANNFMSEVLPSRKVDKKITVSWLIMQRLHQNDPTGYLLHKNPDTIRHICLPATLEDSVSPKYLRKRYDKDGYMDSERLGGSVLKDFKRQLGEFGYAGQFLQNPVPRGGGMFKTDRIVIKERVPLIGNKAWYGLCRFWDKAGTAGGGAYTVGFLMGRMRPRGADRDGADDQWYILDIVRGQWDSFEREKRIKAQAQIDSKKVVIGIEQEPGSGGKESAVLSVKRLAGYRVRVVPAIGSKEDRADSWSVMVNAGGFHMKKAHWNVELIEEMKYFPYSKYKDQVDSGAGAYTLLSNLPKKVGAVG